VTTTAKIEQLLSEILQIVSCVFSYIPSDSFYRLGYGEYVGKYFIPNFGYASKNGLSILHDESLHK
jgi:hypothetical protein